MKIDLGSLAELRPLFLSRDDVHSVAGISGGRTSATMASLLDERTILCFENTSREDKKTYEYIARLEEGLQREIIRLEWRPAPTDGDPPKLFSYKRVDHSDLLTDGSLFRAMLDAIKAFRKTKGKGPVAPWARSRLCTAYLKHRVQHAYVRSLWQLDPKTECFDQFVGLRYDEPSRVHDLFASQRGSRYYRCPLHAAKLTKADVLAFWSRQPFDLELQEPYGNCSGCFLKDQADLARLMNDPECDPDWWESMQEDFPGFGGIGRPSYAQLRGEGPQRLRIEWALRRGLTPAPESMPPRRFKFVVKQEKRRIELGPAGISCACEKSNVDTDEEADQLALDLPEVA